MKLVETAINNTGGSYIHAITEPKGWEIAEHVITELFYTKKIPANMLESSENITDYNFNLKPGELRFIRSDIPPTKPFYETMKTNGEELPPFKQLFYHSTTTVDYVVVLKGPVIMIVGDKETELQTGDCVIQRGAAHAWHNYSNETASIMVVMIGVTPPPQFIRTDTVQPD